MAILPQLGIGHKKQMEFLINKLFSLLAVFSEKRKEDRQLADEALTALNDALNETFSYYKSIEKGAVQDHEKEEKLRTLWSKAAIPLRHIDREFAMICEYKAEFWLNSDHWNPTNVNGEDISLEKVQALYRDLIENK